MLLAIPWITPTDFDLLEKTDCTTSRSIASAALRFGAQNDSVASRDDDAGFYFALLT